MKMTVDHWRCDRCRKTVDVQRPTTGTQEQPAGWSAVQMHSPPLSAEPHGQRQDLCDECTDAFVRFAEGDPTTGVPR